MPAKENLAGQRFGHVTVMHEDPVKDHRRTRWIVQCDCGNQYSAIATAIKKRRPDQNCIRCCKKPGRAVVDVSDCPMRRKHDEMMRRCYDASHYEYEFFGGRGIRVMQEWKDFNRFAADICQFDMSLDVDRHDTDKDWSPDNCFMTDWMVVKYSLGDKDE